MSSTEQDRQDQDQSGADERNGGDQHQGDAVEQQRHDRASDAELAKRIEQEKLEEGTELPG